MFNALSHPKIKPLKVLGIFSFLSKHCVMNRGHATDCGILEILRENDFIWCFIRNCNTFHFIVFLSCVAIVKQGGRL